MYNIPKAIVRNVTNFLKSTFNYAMYILLRKMVLSFLITNIFISCNNITPPPDDEPEVKWELIETFRGLDIRYIQIIKQTMFVAAVDNSISDTTVEKSIIYFTEDGIRWTHLKSLSGFIGPMTSNGDTLYVLMADSIYMYNISTGWRGKYPTPVRLSDPTADGDIIFLGECLYGMQTFYVNAKETYRIYPDGTYEEVPVLGYSYAGAKFIKSTKNGVERVFIRPHWHDDLFYEFDGNRWIRLTSGLTEDELSHGNPTNSMCIHNDTLFAGFKSPASIKFLNNQDEWTRYTDSIPQFQSSGTITVPKTQTTAVTFAENRLFVATNVLGVLEWKSGKWEKVAPGLVFSPLTNEIFDPVVQLEYFKGYLFVGYGKPAYAPWSDLSGQGGSGLYQIKL